MIKIPDQSGQVEGSLDQVYLDICSRKLESVWDHNSRHGWPYDLSCRYFVKALHSASERVEKQDAITAKGFWVIDGVMLYVFQNIDEYLVVGSHYASVRIRSIR